MSINEKLFNDKITEIEKKIKINSPGFISLIGDRGFGKTSTLMNLYAKYENDKNNKNSNLIVLDPIDLKVVSENFTITLLLLSKIESYVENNISSYSTKRDLKCRLEEVIDIILQNKDEINYSYGSSEKVFEVLRKMYNFSKVISNIIDDICKEKNADYFVILLDDFDLTYNHEVSKMFDELLQFFDEEVNSKSSKLRLVFSYNEEQLVRALNETNFKNNSNLFKDEKNKDVNINRIKLHSNAIMKKTFPLNKKVYLPTMSKLYGLTHAEAPIFMEEDLQKIGKNLKSVENETVAEIFEEFLKSVFANEHKAYNAIEGKETMYPQSLRAFYQFKDSLSELIINTDDINQRIIQNDLKINFVESLMRELDSNAELDSLLEEYLSCTIEATNAVLYNGIIDFLSNMDNETIIKELSSLHFYHSFEDYYRSKDKENEIEPIVRSSGYSNIDFKKRQKFILSYKININDNVSIADVIDVMKIYSNYCNDLNDVKYIYYIKIHYSLKIKGTILDIEKSKGNNGNNTFDNEIEKYQKYFNGSVVSKKNHPINLIITRMTIRRQSLMSNIVNLEDFSYELKNLDDTIKLISKSIVSEKPIQSLSFISSHPLYNGGNLYRKDNTSLYKNRENIEKSFLEESKELEGEYFFDHFNLLTTSKYVLDAIENGMYLIYSLFDIEYFYEVKIKKLNKSNKPITLYKKKYVNEYLWPFLSLDKTLMEMSSNKKDNRNYQLNYIYQGDEEYISLFRIFDCHNYENELEILVNATYLKKLDTIAKSIQFSTFFSKKVEMDSKQIEMLKKDYYNLIDTFDTVTKNSVNNAMLRSVDIEKVITKFGYRKIYRYYDFTKQNSIFIETLWDLYVEVDRIKEETLIRVSKVYSKKDTRVLIKDYKNGNIRALEEVRELIKDCKLEEIIENKIDVKKLLDECVKRYK